jgi:molybdenum transport protein
MPTAASRAELERLLADDVPYGDLTTDALGIGAAPGSMAFAVRDKMVLALAEDAAAIIELTGCRVELLAQSGTVLDPGSPILMAHGPASALLRSWKVAQTLIEIWSGVATEARAIVDAATAVAPHIAVACTRKNVPGTKRFAVAAVKAGGAVMHRLGLSETVLVFPEHRAFLGGQSLAGSVKRREPAGGRGRSGRGRFRRDPGGEIRAGRNRRAGGANGVHGIAPHRGGRRRHQPRKCRSVCAGGR